MDISNGQAHSTEPGQGQEQDRDKDWELWVSIYAFTVHTTQGYGRDQELIGSIPIFLFPVPVPCSVCKPSDPYF